MDQNYIDQHWWRDDKKARDFRSYRFLCRENAVGCTKMAFRHDHLVEVELVWAFASVSEEKFSQMIIFIILFVWHRWKCILLRGFLGGYGFFLKKSGPLWVPWEMSELFILSDELLYWDIAFRQKFSDWFTKFSFLDDKLIYMANFWKLFICPKHF